MKFWIIHSGVIGNMVVGLMIWFYLWFMSNAISKMEIELVNSENSIPVWVQKFYVGDRTFESYNSISSWDQKFYIHKTPIVNGIKKVHYEEIFIFNSFFSFEDVHNAIQKWHQCIFRCMILELAQICFTWREEKTDNACTLKLTKWYHFQKINLSKNQLH